MNIIVFGATGRVGESVVEIALNNNHLVTVFVRNKTKVKLQHKNLTITEGDIYDSASLQQLKDCNFDVVINVAGANPLKPSTLVTDAAKTMIDLFCGKQVRYIAITGIAQMKKTFFGSLSIALLKLTPVKHAIKDHESAFGFIKTSALNWQLVGCPYIKDGPSFRKFKTVPVFPGGFKTIHPGDVAIAITDEINRYNYKTITGIWY